MPWWRGAVVYQVYIRSFCDGNGDGQGDFAGLIGKLDYIADLGADAIWLSPIHPSPNRDWGYDVSDYDDVHPDYGTLADFDALLKAAHARGLKILTDEVLCHTSDEHAWFADSRRKGAKSDWYVWADPKSDGTAPNNWLSAFGGPAWSYQPERRQHYHHKFLRQQPKLNWHNPDAKAAALAVLHFWLARGVDGFRLDVANAYLHDDALADNEAVPLAERTAAVWADAANLQHHFHDSNLPENLACLDEIRRTVEHHANRFVFGEFSEGFERSGAYAAPDEGLHSGYTFFMLRACGLSPKFIKDNFAALARHPRHWPCVSFCNHDIVRTVSRFGGGMDGDPALAKLMLALLLSIKGTVLIYQGEELGLPEVDLRRDQLKDPVGDLYYPLFKGRDGCRTPMPWDARAQNMGFSSGTPWLPLGPSHKALAVSEQEQDSRSVLHFAKRFIAVRKRSAALRSGELEFIDAPEPILAFRRTHGAESVLCVFNMSRDAVTLRDNFISGVAPAAWGHGEVTTKGSELTLGPLSSWFAHL
ncbi:MAG: alpha-glucosidase [Alphaproteobacteria bacterium]|nr:alpha-glucosidase C-terminal domain-containing protein [Alphaproteobacteria bacterium]MDE2113084.1 alpha-glucosidase [Alphaproteobacteria bacterium]MDE2492867.1 alpha-glucosidase [Alphaproteobacteria bacterium]